MCTATRLKNEFKGLRTGYLWLVKHIYQFTNLMGRVVKKQCFTHKCILHNKNIKSNRIAAFETLPKGHKNSVKIILKHTAPQNIQRTNKWNNLKAKSTFKASNTFHKRFMMVQNIQWSSITKVYWCWMQLVSQKIFCAWLSLLKQYKEPCTVLWKWVEGK